MNDATAPNAQRLLWAGFFSIFAAGVGFSIRAAILSDWSREYGFTNTELGTITGGGLVGFGVVIILGSLIADRIGYGLLMGLAFLLHVVSALMVLGTGLFLKPDQKDTVYWCLYISMFMFSIANGLCEVVVNPMTAALFPRAKTHFLNILHAGWPGGLIAGGLAGWLLNEPEIFDWKPGWKINWMWQISLFLIPVAIYGVMLIGQRLPRSEASQAGLSLSTMLFQFVSPILLILLFIHAMVGYVELGTDSWISKITGTIMGGGTAGRLLFVYTSGLMFALRFFGGPLEHRLSPLGLLFSCAMVGSLGLVLLGTAEGVLMCVVAATVYGCGKTFLWPTMLAVVSERFPKGGALALGAVGGIGMLSAGLLGGPGIGFKQDYYASKQLKKESESVFVRYESETENTFLTFHVRGLDGQKVGLLDNVIKLEDYKKEAAKHSKDIPILQEEIKRTVEQNNLGSWLKTSEPLFKEDKKPVDNATLEGGRMALLWTAVVPAIMAGFYLLLLLYFKIVGGYKAEVLVGHAADDEKFIGGVEGPMQA